MNIVKTLSDYAKTPFEIQIAAFVGAKLDSSICCEKIKNKDFLIQYMKPLHDFVIYDNSFCFGNTKRVQF